MSLREIWNWMRRHEQHHEDLKDTLRDTIQQMQEGRITTDQALLKQRQAMDRFDQELAAVKAELAIRAQARGIRLDPS